MTTLLLLIPVIGLAIICLLQLQTIVKLKQELLLSYGLNNAITKALKDADAVVAFEEGDLIIKLKNEQAN